MCIDADSKKVRLQVYKYMKIGHLKKTSNSEWVTSCEGILISKSLLNISNSSPNIYISNVDHQKMLFNFILHWKTFS
jgi:hypothetical protein